jgi:CRISPR-associated protein Cmr4
MSDSAAILYLHAVTSLHPGSGTALGVVDLPIQRERHTNWPVVPGSSLKGVLREAMRPKLGGNGEWEAIFGPDTKRNTKSDTESDTKNASAHAGAATFTDARLLAFPVRSLKGVFAWVTCKAVLDRYARDLTLAGITADGLSVSDPPTGHMLTPKNCPLLIEDNAALLEEFDFTRSGDSAPVAEWLSRHAGVDAAAQERLRSHLVVLNETDFTHFAVHATEIIARVGIDAATRTVRDKALFYEEFLPPESLLYAVILASPSRRQEMAMGSGAILARLADNMPPVLQIGAGETIGKGLVRALLRRGEVQQ